MTAVKSSYKVIVLFSAITISLLYVACCISLLCFSTLVLIADIFQVFAHPTIDKKLNVILHSIGFGNSTRVHRGVF